MRKNSVMKDKDEVRVTLRLPSDLYDALLMTAAASRISMNGQIIEILSRVLESDQDHIEAALLAEWSRLRIQLETSERLCESVRAQMALVEERVARRRAEVGTPESDIIAPPS